MERFILYGSIPSVNHMYMNTRAKGKGSKKLKPEAEVWKEETVLLASNWRRKNGWKTHPGKVRVKLWFFHPDRRKRDTHNGLKILLDALEDARIYENDRYALPQIMDFEVDRENPRIEIEFEAV